MSTTSITKRWYVIHVYSGHEKKVGRAIEQLKTACRDESDSVSQRITAKVGEILVPTEKQFEIKNGRRRTVERLIFQGYVFHRAGARPRGLVRNPAKNSDRYPVDQFRPGADSDRGRPDREDQASDAGRTA